jgi:hypothetical protein
MDMAEIKLRTDVSRVEPEKTLGMLLKVTGQKDFVGLDSCGPDCLSVRILHGLVAVTQHEITGLHPAIVKKFCEQPFS